MKTPSTSHGSSAALLTTSSSNASVAAEGAGSRVENDGNGGGDGSGDGEGQYLKMMTGKAAGARGKKSRTVRPKRQAAVPDASALEALEVEILKPTPSATLGITCEPNPAGVGVVVSELQPSALAAKVCAHFYHARSVLGFAPCPPPPPSLSISCLQLASMAKLSSCLAALPNLLRAGGALCMHALSTGCIHSHTPCASFTTVGGSIRRRRRPRCERRGRLRTHRGG